MLNNLRKEVSRRAHLARDIRDRRKIRSAAERYLDSIHYTLYADWDISHPDRRVEAAEWLTNQVIHVLEEMGGNHD